eukprot:661847-Rhodomonas_salina.1
MPLRAPTFPMESGSRSCGAVVESSSWSRRASCGEQFTVVESGSLCSSRSWRAVRGVGSRETSLYGLQSPYKLDFPRDFGFVLGLAVHGVVESSSRSRGAGHKSRSRVVESSSRGSRSLVVESCSRLTARVVKSCARQWREVHGVVESGSRRAVHGRGYQSWRAVHGRVERSGRVVHGRGERVVESSSRSGRAVHGVVHCRGERVTESVHSSGERFTVVESGSRSRGELFTESWRAVHGSLSRVVESSSRSSRAQVVESCSRFTARVVESGSLLWRVIHGAVESCSWRAVHGRGECTMSACGS